MANDGNKQQADILITAGCIVTVDPDRRIIRDGAIAIDGTDIVAVGPRADVTSRFSGRKIIDAPHGLVTPGLIDVHNHPVDYLIKGLVDDTPQLIRLRDRVIPYEEGLTEDEAYAASCATFVEMIRLGTTCFVDGASPQPDGVGRAAEELGIRGVVAYRVMDIVGPFGGRVDDVKTAIARADATLDRWHGSADGRIRACYDIDITPGVSDELALLIRDHAKERGVGIVQHLIGRRPMPGQPEMTRNPDVERLERLGLLGPNMLLAHIGWIPQADVDLLAKTRTNIAHCPASSLVGGNGWVAHGVIPDLVAAGARVVLGTDAVAIARTQDMARIMQLTATTHKDVRRDPTIMNPYDVFEMTTIESAKAIGWDDRIGSLEVGKAADLVIFDTSGPHWWPEPFANPVPDFVYGGTAQDARTVLVNGRILMEDGEFTTADLDAIADLVRSAKESSFARHGFSIAGEWPKAGRSDTAIPQKAS
jgi:5-methylthioadenosine/S-adenosylhomocysteine deaminase